MKNTFNYVIVIIIMIKGIGHRLAPIMPHKTDKQTHINRYTRHTNRDLIYTPYKYNYVTHLSNYKYITPKDTIIQKK